MEMMTKKGKSLFEDEGEAGGRYGGGGGGEAEGETNQTNSLRSFAK